MTRSAMKITSLLMLAALTFAGCKDLWHPEGTNLGTVTFDINGGTGTAPAKKTVNKDSEAALPDESGFSRDGFAFGGWNTSVL